ncbi:hypothetical protein KQX54_013518 [Cotesia glomerata]|uniref:Uncharacterized protein n=1 Tax=Cotesia glomerata TaxID=32391 RepID=A0AAV7J403_COTGL|nr:hypothetical protein KQX54_013518 [Cotesia glomerata]
METVHINVASAVKDLLKDALVSPTFADVSLCCSGGKKFLAHRLVLSAASPYLREVLSAHGKIAGQCEPITMILAEVEGNDLASILGFLYTGSVAVPQARLEAFSSTADALKIRIPPLPHALKAQTVSDAKNNSSYKSYAHVDLPEDCQEVANRVIASPWSQLVQPKFQPILKNKSSNPSDNIPASFYSSESSCIHHEPTSSLNTSTTTVGVEKLFVTRVSTEETYNNNLKILETAITKDDDQSRVNCDDRISQDETINLSSRLQPVAENNNSQLNYDNNKLDKEPLNCLKGQVSLGEVDEVKLGTVISHDGKNNRNDTSDATEFIPKLVSENFKCKNCEKIFTCEKNLKDHRKSHFKEKPFRCVDCGKEFSQLRNYKYHRSVHEGTGEFAATCPECGKSFNDRGYLGSHMKIHRNKKEYACDDCGKSFNQRVAYNMHVRIHTGVKPHHCEQCGKDFSRKMLLKQHMRTHSGERPYQCHICNKAFADKSNMTLHTRLHSGLKPYQCDICSKAFTKKHHLKTHLNYHTGIKPYACPNCKLTFSQSSNMRTHYKKCVNNANNNNTGAKKKSNSSSLDEKIKNYDDFSNYVLTPPHSIRDIM